MRCPRTRGKKSPPHRDPADPPRRRGKQRKGHGTYANARPPIISVISRETGEQRVWVCDHADTWTCPTLIADTMPPDRPRLSTDEWQRYHGSHAAHATVCHSAREWARDDDGDGRREVHCNSCEGAGAALRTYRRVFRGVHTQYRHLYGATDEAMVNTQRVTPQLIRRMCVVDLSSHTGYT
jgi:transposase